LHPAAESFLRGTEPSGFLTTTKYLLSTFGVWLLVEFLRWLTSRIPDRRAAVPLLPPAALPVAPTPTVAAVAAGNGKPVASTYEPMAQQITQRAHELVEAFVEGADVLPQWNEWLKETLEMQQKIAADFEHGRLIQKQRDDLLKLIDELRAEVLRFRDQFAERAEGVA
jgi:hypothetical protein